MSIIRYLLDENIDATLLKALKRKVPGMVVWQLGNPGAPKLQTADPYILTWCETNQFVFVTNNRHIMPAHFREHLAAGRHVAGIFFLSDDMSIGQAIDELELIWSSSDLEEYTDQILQLPI